ncbi:MAG: glycerophosphodiester phosphodiesterase family protein [Pseudomonadota bacterium]
MRRLSLAFFDRPFAHRALHDIENGCPENSISAVKSAVSNGYGVEIDLQLSADDQALVFHDYDLLRLANQKRIVRQTSSEDLLRIRLLGSDDTIPSFDEVLSCISGRVPLLVELKDQHGQLGVTNGALERATASVLKDYDGPVAVMSFNPEMVAILAEILPEVPRGLVTCDFTSDDWPDVPENVRRRLRGIPDFNRVGASFISHQACDLARPRVAELKRQGAAVFCWTIRSPQEEAEARVIADNVTFEGYLAP